MNTQTNATAQSQTITMMDSYIDSPAYTVYEVTTNGMCFNSVFSSLKQAKGYSRKYTNLSSKLYIFKTSCIKTYEPENQSENGSDTEYEVPVKPTEEPLPETPTIFANPLFDFSSMVIKEYGKGYLLVPPKSSEYFGEKYFHNGWWIKKQNAWFFKKSELEMLKENGAQMLDETANLDTLAKAAQVHFEQSQQEPQHHETQLLEDEYYDEATYLSGSVFREHGKGYLLVPPSDWENFGEEYFHNGIWDTEAQGWVFEGTDYNWLVQNGSIEMISDDEQEETNEHDEHSEENFSNMCFEKYGKGYMLYAPKTDPRYMQGYLLEGFWNKNKEGWFFKKQYFNTLESRGARYIKSEDDNVSLCSHTSETEETTPQITTTRRVTRSQTRKNQSNGGNLHLHYSYDEDL